MTETFETMQFGPVETLKMNSTGYVNATMICRRFNRDFKKWLRLDMSKSLIKSLSRNLDVNHDALIIVLNKQGNSHKGTYVHPIVAISVIKWCSDDWEVEFNKIILSNFDISVDVCIPEYAKSIKPIDANSGLYLIDLGTMSSLKEVFDTSDEYPAHYKIAKYGKSNDVYRRFKDHVKNYSVVLKKDPELIYFKHVPMEDLTVAETKLGNIFRSSGLKLNACGYNELIIFDPEMINTIKATYDNI